MSLTKTNNFKKYLGITLLFLLIIAFVTTIPITVNAECGKSCTSEHDTNDSNYCPLCGHIHNFGSFGSIQSSAFNSVVKAHSDIFNFQSGVSGEKVQCSSCDAELADDVLYCPNCNTATANFEIETILKFDVNEPVFGAIMSAAKDLYEALSLLGSVMVFIYFLLEIAEVQLNDGFTYESLTRHALKTIAAIMIIMNGFTIIEYGMVACSDILQSLVDSISSNPVKPFDAKTCPYHDVAGKFLGMPTGAIGVYVYYAIPGLVMDICFIILRVICWARVLDIMIRVILAPIGMADFMHGGESSNGVRYFKKLLSSVLQGACIVATFLCYNELSLCIMNSASGFLGVILLSLALLTMMKQTAGVANDVIGIN